MTTKLREKEILDLIFDMSEAVEEFKYQIRQYGYYDSADDPGWDNGDELWEVGVGAFIAEHHWHPAWKDYVPSKLWDTSMPQVMTYWRLREIK